MSRISLDRRRHQGAPEFGRSGLLGCVSHQIQALTEELSQRAMGRDYEDSAGASRGDSRDVDSRWWQNQGKAEHGGRGGTGSHIRTTGNKG